MSVCVFRYVYNARVFIRFFFFSFESTRFFIILREWDPVATLRLACLLSLILFVYLFFISFQDQIRIRKREREKKTSLWPAHLLWSFFITPGLGKQQTLVRFFFPFLLFKPWYLFIWFAPGRVRNWQSGVKRWSNKQRTSHTPPAFGFSRLRYKETMMQTNERQHCCLDIYGMSQRKRIFFYKRQSHVYINTSMSTRNICTASIQIRRP